MFPEVFKRDGGHAIVRIVQTIDIAVLHREVASIYLFYPCLQVGRVVLSHSGCVDEHEHHIYGQPQAGARSLEVCTARLAYASTRMSDCWIGSR